MKLGSLFSGIGGLEMGLEAALGATTIWQCESDPYAQAVLRKHWGVPIYDDIRHIDETAERPDILVGGWPCVDHSRLGKRAGIEGEKSGLFFELVRCIRLLRPKLVICENVPTLLTAGRGFGQVLAELHSCGFDVWWDCIPAYAVGSPQRRDRTFLICWRPEHRGALADALCRRGPDYDVQAGGDAVGRCGANAGAWGGDPADGDESRLGRMAHGVRGGAHTDRLRCLGNAVVPQVAFAVGLVARELLGRE